MAIEAARLITRIGVEGADAAKREVNSFDDTLKNVSRGAAAMAAALSAGVTAPLVGLIAAANNAGTALNRELGNVQSLGVPIARVQELKTAVQDLAIEVGMSSTALANGLYEVISAFGDTADTEQILAINAKAAAAGLATVNDAIALTSSVTKGYGDASAEAVQHTADLAFMAVNLGQTTFPELAASIGKVVPLTAALGVAQEELFAIMATFTGVTGSASEVATQLRGVLQSLMAPTADMTALFRAQGVASGEALLAQEGLAGSIGLIVAASERSGKPLQAYIGSIEGQTLALAMAGPLQQNYTKNLDMMTNATGALDAAFVAQTQGINANGFAAQRAAVKWEVFLQKLDDGMGPAKSVVMDMLSPLMDKALGLADAFAEMDPAQQQFAVAMAAIAAATGPALIAISAVAGAIATIGWPLLVIGVGVALLAAAWATNWGDIQTKTQTAVDAINAKMDELHISAPKGERPVDVWMRPDPAKMKKAEADWDEMWTGFGEAAKSAETTIAPVLASIEGWLATKLIAAGTSARASWSNTFVGFTNAVTTAQTVMQPVFDTIGGWFERDVPAKTKTAQSDWNTTWTGMTATATAQRDALQPTFDAIVSGLVTQMPGATAAFKADWDTTWGNVATKVGEAWTAVQADGAAIGTWLTTDLPASLATMKTNWDTTWDGLLAKVGSVWAGIQLFRDWLTGLTLETMTGGVTATVAAVTALDWGEFVPDIVWDDLVPDIVWEDLIPDIKWSDFIPDINWESLVPDLSWGDFVKDIKWGSFIPDISWSSFVPTINWGAFIPSLFGGGGGSSGTNTPAPGSGVPGDPLAVTPPAPSPWDVYPTASIAAVSAGGPVVQFTGPVTINNMGDIEQVADQIWAALRRRTV